MNLDQEKPKLERENLLFGELLNMDYDYYCDYDSLLQIQTCYLIQIYLDDNRFNFYYLILVIQWDLLFMRFRSYSNIRYLIVS